MEVSEKRYRYTGKERDEETGFSYHQWRYYAPWLARWIGADPAGTIDEPSLYSYVGNNPVGWGDPSGGFGEAFFAKMRAAQAAVKEVAQKATDVVAGVAVESALRHPIAQTVKGVVDLVEGAQKTLSTGDVVHLANATPIGKLGQAITSVKETVQKEGVRGAVLKLIPAEQVIPQIEKAQKAAAAGDYYSAARHGTKAAQAVGDTFLLIWGGKQALPGIAAKGANLAKQLGKAGPPRLPPGPALVPATAGVRVPVVTTSEAAAGHSSVALTTGGSPGGGGAQAAAGVAGTPAETPRSTKASDTETKVHVNSAGQPKDRQLVANEDQLLAEAEKAAGGSLDNFIERKPGRWISKDGCSAYANDRAPLWARLGL